MDAASSASACLVTSAAPSRRARLAATQETSAEISALESDPGNVSPASAARAAQAASMAPTTSGSAGAIAAGMCARTILWTILNATRANCAASRSFVKSAAAARVSAGTSRGATRAALRRSAAGCAASNATVGSLKYWNGMDATCAASKRPCEALVVFSSKEQNARAAETARTSSTSAAALARRSRPSVPGAAKATVAPSRASVVPDADHPTASVAARRRQSASRRLVSGGAATSARRDAPRTSARASGVTRAGSCVVVSSRAPHCFRRQLRVNVAAARRRAEAHPESEATPRSAMHSPAASLDAAASSLAVASSRAAASKPATASSAMPSFSGFGAVDPVGFAFRAAVSAPAGETTAATLVVSVRAILVSMATTRGAGVVVVCAIAGHARDRCLGI